MSMQVENDDRHRDACVLLAQKRHQLVVVHVMNDVADVDDVDRRRVVVADTKRDIRWRRCAQRRQFALRVRDREWITIDFGKRI